jgi:hypothetical protein
LVQAELRVSQLEPRKRRRVKTSLNSRFADIRAIKQAQIEVEDREIEEDGSDLSDNSASTRDFIKVEGL